MEDPLLNSQRDSSKSPHSLGIKQDPLVSFIIPAYNAETFIAQTLRSVLGQSYRHIEVLIVNDGSQDSTSQIVQEYMREDGRIRLLHQANAGVAAARNLGIENSQGSLIAPIDADDLWHPNALEQLVEQLGDNCPEVGVAYAWSVDIDEHNQPTGGFHAAKIDGYVYKTLICHNFLGHASATLIRKSCLELIGGYDVKFKAQNAQGCEDWDLYIRLAENHKFAVVPEFLIGYRRVLSSMSKDCRQMARSQQHMLQRIQSRHPEIPSFVYRLSRSSFYLYLAHECSSYGYSRAALSWLLKTLRIDLLAPLVRPEFTILLAKNTSNFLFRWPKSTRQKALEMPAPVALKRVAKDDLCEENSSIYSVKASRIKIWLKLLLGSLLHHSLSLV